MTNEWTYQPRTTYRTNKRHHFSVFKMGSKWGIKRTLSITGLSTIDFYSGIEGPYLFANALSSAKRFRWKWLANRKLKTLRHDNLF